MTDAITLPPNAVAFTDEQGRLTVAGRAALERAFREITGQVGELSDLVTAITAIEGSAANIIATKADKSLLVLGSGSIDGGLATDLSENRVFQLENDQAAPPASYVYGTDTEGTKGWRPEASGGSSTAADVSYDNATSGLTATEVQAAIDEIVAGGGGGGAVSSVNGATGAVIVLQPIQIAVSDETTALTTGTAKTTFRMPFAMTLTAVRASVTTAPTGAVLTVDINEGGVSILSTKLTIDATEKTSTTAATAAVISDSSLADDAEITIDIDTVGSSVAGAGLKVTLIGYKTP